MFKVGHPQNFLRIDFFLKNCSSSEFSEDFLFFESLPSSQFSDDPQNFLRIDPLLFESWSSSEFSEDPQNFLRMMMMEKNDDDDDVEHGRHDTAKQSSKHDILAIVLTIFWGSSVAH